MGRDPKKQQQAAAKKKVRREKRKVARASAHEQAADWRWGASRSAVRQAPIHACLMTADLFKIGIGHVVIARRLPSGEIVGGWFMVDAQCLGVKGALLAVQSSAVFDDCVRKLGIPNATREIEPAYARKLIEHSVKYAQSIGFLPHENYHDATAVFGDINPDDCSEEFTFGRDGKPFYVSGPHDSVQKRALILATLQARCGDGNYDYLVFVGENPPPDFFE
jgi:hypothetical protein